jgi:hypothetical protein
VIRRVAAIVDCFESEMQRIQGGQADEGELEFDVEKLSGGEITWMQITEALMNQLERRLSYLESTYAH